MISYTKQEIYYAFLPHSLFMAKKKHNICEIEFSSFLEIIRFKENVKLYTLLGYIKFLFNQSFCTENESTQDSVKMI